MRRRARKAAALAPTAALAFVAVMLGGCRAAPPYKKPEVPVPDRYVSEAATAETNLDEWWRGFADPQLQALVAQALQSNLDLRSAVARVRQAREQEIIAGAAQLPSVGASGAGVGLYSKSNPLAGLMSGGSGGNTAAGSSGGGGSGSGGNSSTHLHVFALALDATWEVDLFGGVQSSVEAARATTEAQIWQLRDGEVSLTAEVANDYLTVRALQARRVMLIDSIAHEEELLELAGARLRAGLASELDVNQERTQLARDEAQLPQLDAQFGVTMNALAVLLGEAPESMKEQIAPVAVPPEAQLAIGVKLPPGLPSELLRRRPDVRAAERRLAAASGDVGVAVAKLYPSFDLIGAASLASGSLHSLLNTRSFAALGIGDVMWPVFAGGKLQANVRANEAARDAAYLAYQNSILAALQDAETAIIRCTTEEHRLEALQNYVSAATSSAKIAEDEYRSGIVDFTTVLSASDAELNARDALVQSRQTLAQARISLYKALGGGWSDSSASQGEAGR